MLQKLLGNKNLIRRKIRFLLSKKSILANTYKYITRVFRKGYNSGCYRKAKLFALVINNLEIY